MKYHWIRSLLVLAALVALISPAALRPARSQTTGTTYTLTDLGHLAGSAYAAAAGINNAGQVAGESVYTDGNLRAFRVDPSGAAGAQAWFVDANHDGLNDLLHLTGLPKGNYHYSVAWGINAGGQVVGTSQQSLTQLPGTATVWSPNGTATAVGGGSGSTVTDGFGINDNGDLVGDLYSTKNYVLHAYLWTYANGSYTATDLGLPAGYSGARARSVNNLRQVVGWLYQDNGPTASFLWLPSAAYGLPRGMNVLSGINVHQINNSGIIAGSDPSGSHTTLWVPPGAAAAYGLNDDLNDIHDPTWVGSHAVALNNPAAGTPLQVVGYVTDASGQQPGFVWDSATRAMRNPSDPRVTVNLPPGFVVSPASDGSGQLRSGVNAAGQVAMSGTYRGTNRAVVLAPNP